MVVLLPDIKSMEFYLFKERWNGLDLPRHLSFYTPRTLNSLMRAVNLERRLILQVVEPRTFIGSLSNLESSIPSSLAHSIAGQALAWPFALLTAWFNMSSVMFGCFQKAAGSYS